MKDMSIKKLQRIIDSGKQSILDKLYLAADQSSVLDRLLVSQLWYKTKPLTECSEEQIEALLQAAELDQYDQLREDYFAYAEENVPLGYRSRLKKIFQTANELKPELGPLEETDANGIAKILETMKIQTCEGIRLHLVSINAYGQWLESTGHPAGQSLGMLKPRYIIKNVPLEPGMKARCVGSPKDLYQAISQNYQLGTGNKGPIAFVLAWLGFTVQESIGIKVDEVDMDNHTIRGKKVPDELWPVVSTYINVTVEIGSYSVTDMGAGGVLRTRTFSFAKSDMLIKNTRGSKVTANAVQTQVQDMPGLTLGDVWLSGRYYELYELDLAGGLDDKAITEVFDVKQTQAQFKQRIANIIREYTAFKSVFHANGT